MTQEERWKANWQEVMDFMEVNKRRPSKYVPEEKLRKIRGRFFDPIYNKG